MWRCLVARRGRGADDCDGGQMLHADSVALDTNANRMAGAMREMELF